MFPEEFLHFIWQFQYFEASGLQTTDGQTLVVSRQGFHNTDAGPDFKEARIGIAEMEWNGSVEIHLKSSDWHLHRHQFDKAYDSVILHVVWEADREILRTDGTLIPQLELNKRVSLQLLAKYQDLVQQSVEVPCQTHLGRIDAMKLQSMIDRALVERLQRKTRDVTLMLKKYGGDWDATALHFLVKYFGFKKNEAGFQLLSQRISFKIVQKVASDLSGLEAYFMGLAGFPEQPASGPYAQLMTEKFNYINHKFQLIATNLPAIPWKFMRMRPANFPTVRLAQLAAIVHRSPRLFAAFIESDLPQLRKIFKAEVSPYWQAHYRFGEERGSSPVERSASMGDKSVDILIINCVVPLLFAYGREQGNADLEDKALSLLGQLQFEQNSYTKKLSFMPLQRPTAYESQAYLELYRHYCLPRRCLSCQVGIDLIRQSK